MKKILSIALALCLCLGALPMGAQAAETITTPLDFTNVGDGEGETPAEGPGYKLEGNKDSGYTLTLDGISMNIADYGEDWAGGKAAIRLPSDGNVTVVLNGENRIVSLEDGVAIGCYGNHTVTFQGSGTLSAESRSSILHTEGDMNIKDATIGNSSPGAGLFCLSGNITIESATIQIESEGSNSCGIFTENGNVTISNSTVTVSCTDTSAIGAKGNITITGGTVDASSNVTGQGAITADATLSIGGKAKITANVTSAGSSTLGLFATNVTISQSEVTAKGAAAAIGCYNNGTITLEKAGIVEPEGGEIGSRAITDSSGQNATRVRIAIPVLNEPASTPTCTYGESAKVTLTTTPPIDSAVTVEFEGKEVGKGKTNEEITLDTSKLNAGERTLTARVDGLEEKEFTVKVEKKNISEAKVELVSPEGDIEAGKIFEPEVKTVTLDGRVLTQGTDYTLDTKSFSTPGTHRVMVSGQGNYCGTAFTELNLTAVCKLDKPADRNDLQVAVGEVKVVQTPGNYDTVEKIQTALRGKMPGVAKENISYLDVTLQVQKDGAWKPATTDDFPAGGITVTLPYPDGVTKDNQSQYQFIVVHLPYYDNQYWPLETITPTAVDDGLMCTFTSLCPVAIGYKAKSSGGGGGGGGGGTPSGPCTGGPGCPSRAFADLDTSLWYHEATDFVLQNRLMDGYGNGLFGPGDNLTRAQFAQILYNRAGRPQAPEDCPFTDVAPGAWYAPAIRWAASQGVLEGYGGGRFGPEDAITREQLAAMLWRYAGKPGAAGSGPDFTDADKISGYALSALRWAVEQGIVQGRGGGILDPAGTATRAEAAQMVMKYLKRY